MKELDSIRKLEEEAEKQVAKNLAIVEGEK